MTTPTDAARESAIRAIYDGDNFDGELGRENLIEAYDSGYAAAQASHWHKIEDGLPDIEQPGVCLGTALDGKVKLCYFDKNRLTPALSDSENIIAWMLLPASFTPEPEAEGE